MREPYEVLGVARNASMDEIKKTYKQLIKKYHPDQYQNNPLADLAQDKLKEINEAYKAICDEREGSSSYNYGYAGGQSASGAYSSSGTQPTVDYNAVRSYIDMGNLDAAANILSNVSDRSAEWYFLSGMVAYRRGWYDQSVSLVQQAANMDPNNYEYQRNLQAMQGGNAFRNNNTYNRGGYAASNTDDIFCRACEMYMCMDCLCDCF